MSRVLIAVMTCKRDRWMVPHHRKMLEGHGADVFFFMGEGNYDARHPEVLLSCREDYDMLIHKNAEMFKWALKGDYDYVFKIDSDTFVDVSRLLAADLQDDWAGLMGDEGAGGGKAHCTSGGVGIWLSRFAMETFLSVYPKLPPGRIVFWDDWCLSWMLAEAGIVPRHEIRFWNDELTPRLGWRKPANWISWHGWQPPIKHPNRRGPTIGLNPCENIGVDRGKGKEYDR